MLRIATYIVLLFSLLLLTSSSMKSGAAVNATPLSWDNPSPEYRTVKARSGDTLKRIAQRLDVPVAELVRINGLSENTRLPKGTRIHAPVPSSEPNDARAEVVGNRITLADGYSFEADEVWKDGDEIWFRKGNISQRLYKPVSSVRPIIKPSEPPVANSVKPGEISNLATVEVTPNIWIYLNGGARFRVDDVQETSDGAWYSRANLSIFLERSRIARIERELPGNAGGSGSRNRDWTSGNAWIDSLIKTNGARHGLDPYLIFLVIEHESHFRRTAVSPKGARGLMQLMPGTARRLGVRDSFDPDQNIMGGSRYLKELMNMFGGRVDLVLASYNAGEGAVMKYGRAVPPYRETRDYVKKITRRYGDSPDGDSKNGKSPGADRAP